MQDLVGNNKIVDVSVMTALLYLGLMNKHHLRDLYSIHSHYL